MIAKLNSKIKTFTLNKGATKKILECVFTLCIAGAASFSKEQETIVPVLVKEAEQGNPWIAVALGVTIGLVFVGVLVVVGSTNPPAAAVAVTKVVAATSAVTLGAGKLSHGYLYKSLIIKMQLKVDWALSPCRARMRPYSDTRGVNLRHGHVCKWTMPIYSLMVYFSVNTRFIHRRRFWFWKLKPDLVSITYNCDFLISLYFFNSCRFT